MGTIGYIFLASLALVGVFYFLSWIQMKAWLQVIDEFFNDKITEYLTKFKNKTDEK
jgi:hypothetical protein